jgi:hypothetical protein
MLRMRVIRAFLFERLAEPLQLENERLALWSDSVAARVVGNPIAARLAASVVLRLGAPALRLPVLHAILLPHDGMLSAT